MTEHRSGDGAPRGDEQPRSDETMPGWRSTHGSLSDNLVFASVDSPRRRLLLYALQQEDGEANVDELAQDVAAIERDADAFESADDHGEILEEIYDAELPKLSDIGIVDLHESSGTVELGPYAEELDIDGFEAGED